MNLLSRYHAHPAKRAMRFAAIIGAIAGATIAAGCPNTTGESGSSDGGSDGGSSGATPGFGRLLTQGSVDRIDLLLAVDNSRSMADKQAILALAIPDLVAALVNPPCLDANGVPAAPQPASPLDQCPAGTRRDLAPVLDVHIGVVSSSIGGHGADVCPNQDGNSCPSGTNFSNNDKGHLLSRLDPCGGGAASTYQDKGFLAWDPRQILAPPGEANEGTLNQTLRDMVTGVGQIGCGYESQLESWYRFLIDPEPYETISVIDNKATPQGIDNILLAQRAEFLRPDSLLAIVMLSDENDCSIKEYGQFFFAAQLKNGNGTQFHLPRARAECASDPNDPCCRSCGQGAGDCPADPTCFDANSQVKPLTALEDPANLRCFDQKRRFGIDFLHPIDRYTQALSSTTVPNRAGDLVPNPIFTDLNPTDEVSRVRDASLVLLASIVGVPWQDIARDPTSLAQGFKNHQELIEKDASGLTTWDVILGDPAQYVPPKDPHMIESIDPRGGVNPITGDAIAPPGSPNGTNPINGHEYTPTQSRDDLQFACIFELPVPRDCQDSSIPSCDCRDPFNDSPLCEADPSDPGSRTLQVRAKAYPSVRELAVTRALGVQGITASVCPAQLNDDTAADFGYRPAVGAIVERVKGVGGGQCLSRTLEVDAKGELPCTILEARAVPGGSAATCNQCDLIGRKPADAGLVSQAQKDPIAATAGWNCFCEIAQAEGADLAACQSDASATPINQSTMKPVNAWCYVDATTSPPLGNPAIVASCPEAAKRQIRFVGGGGPIKGATVFLACGQ
jgi:hypothetical protein